MAYFEVAQGQGAIPGFFRHGADAVKRVARRWNEASERRRNAAILRGLDDRTLKDIGLSRTEITSATLHGGSDLGRRFGR
ncbi:MAG: DUF1127 domain-containing protein [bacterium]|nr:DUF1127 domain-containing protein [bacterium]